MRSSSLFLIALVLCLFTPNDQCVLAKGVHLLNVGTATWDQPPPSQQLVQTRSSKPNDDFQKRLNTLVGTSRIDNVMKIRGGVVISKGKKVRLIDIAFRSRRSNCNLYHYQTLSIT